MRRPLNSSALIGYGVAAVSVFLAWEVLKAPVIRRAPPSLAIRLSPTSPEALSRAAEGELNAGRLENARGLADEALQRAPFNARTLRVRGLVAAKLGQEATADQLLTLAGNLSLRDDPAHGWLVERRLKQGNYGSAFAHADTLVRRRDELQPQVFSLFTQALETDPRAVAPFAQIFSAHPPWRADYLTYLMERPAADPVLLMLARAMQHTPGPLSRDELMLIYRSLLAEGRVSGILYLQEHLRQPDPRSPLQNGSFDKAEADRLPPLDWQFGSEAGVFGEIVERIDDPSNPALHVQYDGRGNTPPVYQLIALPPGRHRLSGVQQLEAGQREALRWVARCVGSEQAISEPSSAPNPSWSAFSMTITVPASGCSAQWLRLEPRSADRRQITSVYYDQMAISSVSPSS